MRVLPSALDDDSLWYFKKQYRDIDDNRKVTALSGAAQCQNVIESHLRFFVFEHAHATLDSKVPIV